MVADAPYMAAGDGCGRAVGRPGDRCWADLFRAGGAGRSHPCANRARRDDHTRPALSAWNGRVLVLGTESTIEPAAVAAWRAARTQQSTHASQREYDRRLMRPPTGPNIIDHLFGLPFLTVRWYGVLIVSGAILAGYLATRRARAHGINEEHVWNQLLLGMLLGIIGARMYYVAFEWQRYAGRPLLEIINPQGGGLAIHGAIIGALIAVLIYTRRHQLPLLTWLDICVPTLLIGQALG